MAAVFEQLRESVARYRLLLDAYPFHYRLVENRFIRTTETGRNGQVEDSTLSVDTVRYDSRAHRAYRVGHVVSVDTNSIGAVSNVIYLPTFDALAESAFQSAHCFTYGGTAKNEIRIDFTPADSIKSPDVDGSVYLDSRRYVVTRAVFGLTHPSRVHPPVIAFTLTTTFVEALPLVPLADHAVTEQTLAFTVRTAFVAPRARVSITDDQLLDHDPIGVEPAASSAILARTALASTAPGACATPTPIDTAGILIYGTLVAGTGTPLHEATARRMLDGLLQAFQLPSEVEFPVFADAADDANGATLHPTLSGEVTFTVDRTGRVANVTVDATSLSPVVDSALVAAVRKAEGSKTFSPTTAGQFRLSLSSAEPGPDEWSGVFTRLRVPSWHFARRAQLDSTSHLSALNTGRGAFEVVVDEHGSAVPLTLRVVGKTSPSFADSIQRALPRIRFTPAIIGACPVKQVLRQTLEHP